MTKKMIDLSQIIDNGTEFPRVWKTLVRELLLKFEDGGTYHHDNIAGNRPYHISLEIVIDEPVDYEEDKRLHDEVKKREANAILYNDLFCQLISIVTTNNLLTEELKDSLTDLGVDFE